MLGVDELACHAYARQPLPNMSSFSSSYRAFSHPQVQYWAPASAGAGVTLVMAYLNGNHIPNLLRWETLITKLVGTICSVSAGLPMGPEVRGVGTRGRRPARAMDIPVS